VDRETGQDFCDILAENLLICARGEESTVIIVCWEYVLDHAGKDPECVFGCGHDEQEVGRYQVHALAVTNDSITTSIGQEDLVEFSNARALAEEDVVGEGAVYVHLDLGNDGRVNRLAGSVVDKVIVVTRDTKSRRPAALCPDLGAQGNRNSTEDKSPEFFPFGPPNFAFVAETRYTNDLTVCERSFGHQSFDGANTR